MAEEGEPGEASPPAEAEAQKAAEGGDAPAEEAGEAGAPTAAEEGAAAHGGEAAEAPPAAEGEPGAEAEGGDVPPGAAGEEGGEAAAPAEGGEAEAGEGETGEAAAGEGEEAEGEADAAAPGEEEEMALGDDLGEGEIDAEGVPPPEDAEDADAYAGFDEEEDQYDHEGGSEAGFEEEEEAFEEQGDPLQDLKDKFEELAEQNERLQQDNVSLQRRVIQWKAQREKYDAAEKPPSEGKVTEHKYLNVLNHVHGVRLRLRMQQVKSARMSDELKNQLEEKRAKAIECRDSFRDFKRQVARHAEYSRTGKRIPLKIIQEVEDFELDKDAEVEEVRGSNISLKNRMAKLEQALRKKDELADNLHVIDFEQLKIENQTLNEKIEERNEELHKLRKKTVITVQVITHMREKLQFIQQENQVLKTELQQLDQELASQRDLVAKTKHERDDYRSENAKLRQQTGIINSELLTKDYEDRQNHLKRLKEELQQLKSKHRRMMQFIKEHSEPSPQETY